MVLKDKLHQRVALDLLSNQFLISLLGGFQTISQLLPQIGSVASLSHLQSIRLSERATESRVLPRPTNF